jgi:hypothetical protein
MRKMLRSAAVAVSLAVAFPAMAQVSLDLKVGYAVPTGSVQVASPVNPGETLASKWSGAIPMELALRYRFGQNVSAGAYFQWGPAFVASTSCPPGGSCSGYDMRFGLELVYGFTPGDRFNPWLSIGTGWEFSQLATSGGGTSSTQLWSGWEYLNLQIGLDYKVASAFAVGPYAGIIGGTYSNLKATFGDQPFNRAVDPSARSFHGWWQFGLKGTLNL